MSDIEKSLILFRGIQGSGKSSVADAIENYDKPYYTASTVEADSFRNYAKAYDARQNEKAHNWCQLEVERRMNHEHDVVFCANTFLYDKHIAPYRVLCKIYGYKLFIIRVNGWHNNIHGVPDHVVACSNAHIEDVDGEILFDNTGIYRSIKDNPQLFYLRQALIQSGVNSKWLRYYKDPNDAKE